jgi:hypothetical protein
MPILYSEDFEHDDPVSFWSAIGEYEVHEAGLTSERSRSGRRAYKLDITFLRHSRNSFWSGPVFDLPALPGTTFGGHLWLERVPEHVEVSLGIGFYLPALEAVGRSDARGSRMMLGSFNSRSQTGCWHEQTSDVHAAGEGMSLKLAGEVTPGLRLEKWHLNIQCREAVDARLVLYIDDICVTGPETPPAWARQAHDEVRAWSTRHRHEEEERATGFHRALEPIHEEARQLAARLPRVVVPPSDGPWRGFAADMLTEADGVAAELLARAAPDNAVPRDEGAVELHLHDLRDRWLRPLRWALSQAQTIARHRQPYLLTVGDDPVTNQRILPTSRLLIGDLDGALDLLGTAGEHVPACLVIVPERDTVATFDVAPLRSEGTTPASIPVDLKVVKAWYQAGVELDEVGGRVLTPELLLDDDALVEVDLEAQQNRVRDLDRPRDADELQPLKVAAGAAQQLWLTVRVPEATPPGRYQGSIGVRLAGLGETQVPLRLEVLPFRLEPAALHYGLYYRGTLADPEPDFVSSEGKSAAQLEAEFRNMRDHGILYPDVYERASLRADGSLDVDALERYLDIRDRAGLPRDKLFYNGSSIGARPTQDQEDELVGFCRQLLAWARKRGFEEVYFFGSDEAFGEELAAQRRVWSRVRELGGKMTVACSKGFFELVGDLLDLPIVNRTSPHEVPKVHALGHRICNYSLPQGGVEQPFRYRYFFGLWLLRTGMDGSRTYAYQHAFGAGESMGRAWDDFDNVVYRSHMLTYPTVDGVVDTVQWEGVRAAVDDVRYATTLRAAIAAARQHGDDQAAALAQASEDWLDDIDLRSDLQALRREMAVRIRRLHGAAGGVSDLDSGETAS